MKAGILSIVLIMFIAVGCSKQSTTTASPDRDKFVGTYHMHDSAITVRCNGCSPTGSTLYDTTSRYYDMIVASDSRYSDRVVFNNIANFGRADSALVSGSIASFTVCASCSTSNEITTAALAGNNIKLSGGYYEVLTGYNIYSSGTGVKF